MVAAPSLETAYDVDPIVVTKAASTLAPKAVQKVFSISTVPVNLPRDHECYNTPEHGRP